MGPDVDSAVGTTEESAPSDEGFPWPPPTGSVVDALGHTWWRSVFQPRTFYRNMPPRAAIGPVLVYYLGLGVLAEGIQLFWSTVLGSLGDQTAWLERLGLAGSAAAWSPAVGFLLSPLYLLVSLFVAAGVTHLLLRILAAGSGGFNVTLRTFAFSYGPALFRVLPVLGTLVGSVWMIVVVIIGLREGHATSGARAAAAVLLPLVGLAFLYLLMLLLLAAGQMLLNPLS